NIQSYSNLEENLREYGRELKELPHVIQWNKRDLPDALPVAEPDPLAHRVRPAEPDAGADAVAVGGAAAMRRQGG
ncbi:MAG: GTP-binding protein, partial [Actinomycetota bacterium]